MRDVSIARNYAEALYALGAKAGEAEAWGATIGALADAVSADRKLAQFLEAPQISAAEKNTVLGKALAGKAHKQLVLFVQKLVTNRRQMLLGEIAVEYHNLLDEKAGRVHARVTVARPYDAAATEALGKSLSAALGKTVVPHVQVDERIIGGVVVRVGDRVMDGSVKRKLGKLRDALVGAR